MSYPQLLKKDIYDQEKSLWTLKVKREERQQKNSLHWLMHAELHCHTDLHDLTAKKIIKAKENQRILSIIEPPLTFATPPLVITALDELSLWRKARQSLNAYIKNVEGAELWPFKRQALYKYIENLCSFQYDSTNKDPLYLSLPELK